MSQFSKGDEIPVPKDFRAKFTQFMSKPETRENANAVAYHSVSAMNRKMATDGVPMSKSHYKAAATSIAKGDSICQFMKAEHDHVMHSTGKGYTYTAGKLFHEYIVSPFTGSSEE